MCMSYRYILFFVMYKCEIILLLFKYAVDWLRANLMIPHSECILSFVAPEETAVRSRHSHVVKIYLRYSSASRKSFNNELVHVVLLKRCVAKDLSSRAIEKLARDVNSYANESMYAGLNFVFIVTFWDNLLMRHRINHH